MTSYPPLSSDRLLPLRLIAQRLQDDPNYLDKPACPYTGEVKVWLKSVFARRDEVRAVAVVCEAVDLSTECAWTDVARQARQLYAELDVVKAAVGQGDTSERIQLAKAQAGLLERLISVGEKAIGLKQNAEFQRIMLGVVDDLLNDEQRVEMMKRLGEAA